MEDTESTKEQVELYFETKLEVIGETDEGVVIFKAGDEEGTLLELNEMRLNPVIEVVEEDTEEKTEDDPVSLDKLPIHVLRDKLKDMKITFKTSDKKSDLIKMIESGETIHTKKEIERAPKLEEQKTERALPVVPKEIRGALEAMRDNDGLHWDIDEANGCINFKARLTTCANLDQPANNILKAAQMAVAKGATLPRETGREGIA